MLRKQYPAQRFKGKGQLKWEKGAEKHIFVPPYAQLRFRSTIRTPLDMANKREKIQ